MEMNIRVEGLQELERQLVKLGAEMGTKTLNQALMSASLPTMKRAKSEAPGSIKKAISRVKHRSNRTLKLSKVGRSAGGKQAAGVSIIVRKKKAPFAHMIHDGTKPRYTKGKGKKRPYKNAYRGQIKPNPFLKEAWKAEGEQKAINIFQNKLKQRIKKLTK